MNAGSAPTRSLAELGLVDAPAEDAYDSLTTLAARLLGVPVTLVSLVEPERDRQYFKSQQGLPAPWAEARQTPLSHSFCREVRACDRPLVVPDTREDPALRGNPAIHDLNVIAYLGVPIHDPDGRAVGAFCAIDGQPRPWTAEETDTMRRLGACVSDQIRLKAALLDAEEGRRAAEAAATSRSRFLAQMSHEVRTPLTGILGAAELLAAAPRDGTERRLLDGIAASGELLLRLTNDTLDLARIDAGKLELAPAPFVPAELATRLADLHRPAAEARGLALSLAIEGDAETPRMGDAHRVQQILGNLLSNAVKFTAEGEVRLTLAATAHGLAVKVRDTGPGMSEAALARLFEPFEQADASVARRHGGTGLGMAIVKRLAEAMGGHVAVYSRPGAGTEATVHLPMPAAAPAVVAPGRPDAPGQSLAGLRLLVADDTASNRLILTTMLARLGARAEAVADGRAVLARLAAAPFDALLCDLRMPDMDGAEIIAALRAREMAEGRPRLPALAVTGAVFSDEVARLLAAGFDRHLPKPVRQADLLAAVQAVVAPAGARAAG